MQKTWSDKIGEIWDTYLPKWPTPSSSSNKNSEQLGKSKAAQPEKSSSILSEWLPKWVTSSTSTVKDDKKPDESNTEQLEKPISPQIERELQDEVKLIKRMQYREIEQDLFTMDSSYYLAHCIASDFRLGAGIALEFQKRFELQEKLKHVNGDTSPGTCVLIERVFNLITKPKSSGKPTYETLESSLLEMKKLIIAHKIKRLAMPKIGCGLDKLQWENVREMIQSIFSDCDIEIVICKWKR